MMGWSGLLVMKAYYIMQNMIYFEDLEGHDQYNNALDLPSSKEVLDNNKELKDFMTSDYKHPMLIDKINKEVIEVNINTTDE